MNTEHLTQVCEIAEQKTSHKPANRLRGTRHPRRRVRRRKEPREAPGEVARTANGERDDVIDDQDAQEVHRSI